MSKQVEVFTDELFAAIEEHNLSKAKECIMTAAYIGINKVFNGEKYGMKPISFTVKKNSLEILNLLVKSGASTNAANSEDSRTALHIAAEYGREEAGQFLLSNLADVNSQDIRGKTPLHLASFNCRVGMVKLLIDNNANSSIRDVDDKTASDVIGDNPELMCETHIIEKILSMLQGDVRFDYKATLLTRNLKALEAGNTADVVGGSAVKPVSFINSIFSRMGASTAAALSNLFYNAPALPSVQQSIVHSASSPNSFLSSENIAFASCVAEFLDNTPSKRFQDLTSKGIKVVPDINIAVRFTLKKFDSFVEKKIRDLDSKEQDRIRTEVKSAHSEIVESFRRGVEFSGNIGLDDVLEKCKECFCTNVLPKDKVSTCLSDIGVTKLGNNLSR